MGGPYNKMEIVSESAALKGRDQALVVSDNHVINGNRMKPPYPDGMQMATFGMGCFWGVERLFWKQKGVYSTASGYAGGYTKNPTYEEVCEGGTGHTEVVRIVFDPRVVTYQDLLILFWENHDPTMGMRQGEAKGAQYRSAIYTYGDSQSALAHASRDAFQTELRTSSHSAHSTEITTEIHPAGEFYFAEDYHQQYLHTNPEGYCGLKGVGATFPRSIKA